MINVPNAADKHRRMQWKTYTPKMKTALNLASANNKWNENIKWKTQENPCSRKKTKKNWLEKIVNKNGFESQVQQRTAVFDVVYADVLCMCIRSYNSKRKNRAAKSFFSLLTKAIIIIFGSVPCFSVNDSSFNVFIAFAFKILCIVIFECQCDRFGIGTHCNATAW